MSGSRIIAENTGNNTFRIDAENVRSFALYLSEQMGDLDRKFTLDCKDKGKIQLSAVAVNDDPDYKAKLIVEF